MSNELYLENDTGDKSSPITENSGSQPSAGINNHQDLEIWRTATTSGVAASKRLSTLELAFNDAPQRPDDGNPKDRRFEQFGNKGPEPLEPRERLQLEENIRQDYVSGGDGRERAKKQSKELINREINSGDLAWAQKHLTQALERFPEWAKHPEFQQIVKRSGAWFNQDFSKTFNNLESTKELWGTYKNLAEGELDSARNRTFGRLHDEIKAASQVGNLTALKDYADNSSYESGIVERLDHDNRRGGALALDCLALNQVKQGNNDEAIKTLRTLFNRYPEATNSDDSLNIAGRAGYMYNAQRSAAVSYIRR